MTGLAYSCIDNPEGAETCEETDEVNLCVSCSTFDGLSWHDRSRAYIPAWYSATWATHLTQTSRYTIESARAAEAKGLSTILESCSYAAHDALAVIANSWHYQNILTQFWVPAEFGRAGLF